MAWAWSDDDKASLRYICALSYFSTFFSVLASSDNKNVVELRHLAEVTGLPYELVLEFAKEMDNLSFCRFYKGRKGWPTRLEFYHVSAAEVGQVALDEKPVEVKKPDLVEGVRDSFQFCAEEVSARIAEAKRSLASAIGIDAKSIDIRIQLKGEVVVSG